MVYVGLVTCDENLKLCDKLPAESSVLYLIQGATPSKSLATILKEAVVSLCVLQEVVVRSVYVVRCRVGVGTEP